MAPCWFSPPVQRWFSKRFRAPTEAQARGWDAISQNQHTLIFAPTGSGKTLAAFLVGIDRVMTSDAGTDGTSIVYLSPLRALAVDVDRNLIEPLAGIAATAREMGVTIRRPTVGVRTGDTSAQDRRKLVRDPPDILITTPESLYLMLTSQARETLRTVHTVIIDEIHALAPNKRGSHLALSLERLGALSATPIQRIGLSATQHPLEEISRFLGGFAHGRPRPVTIVDPPITKRFDLAVTVPAEDMTNPQATSHAADPGMWPSIHTQIFELIAAHHTTLVFVNSRRLAERLAQSLNELDPHHDDDAPLVVAHHGSLSRERRLMIEHQLKAGQLRALVATSSLELGIDMGAIDLVIQVSSPGSVSRGLQRVGRAGHNVGDVSVGRVFPTHRHDLLEATVIVERMSAAQIEATRYPRNPIDVAAQHVVSACAMEDWNVDDLYRLFCQAAPFHRLSNDSFRNVIDLLSGRYPSERFRQLRPRIVWDRVHDTVHGRSGSQLLAVTNPGTIPERGLFGVFLPDGVRVGELDEEMVHESRPGETFTLGSTAWRIEEITFDRVVVTPAPGAPARMPFWHGDGPGRPVELGIAVGTFCRNIADATPQDATERLRAVGLDDFAAQNLIAYLEDQRVATGAIPDDTTVVVERFRDEIGDWRVCIHSPLGARVLAPWALALRARLSAAFDQHLEVLWSDDGIAIRLPEGIDELDAALVRIDPTEIDDLVTTELPGSALFASRFREAAGRALLLPRRRPGQRTSLWQQRQRAADLLGTVVDYPDFPILLEVVREIINDDFDLPALRTLLADIAADRVALHRVDTTTPSPFAQSLVFGWAATFMYEGDAPAAERKAAALQLDPSLLRQLLGKSDLRDLLDADALARLEAELARVAPGSQATTIDALRDVVAALGPIAEDHLAACFAPTNPELTVSAALEALVAANRIVALDVADKVQWIVIEDGPLLRDGLGMDLDLPGALAEPYPHATRELVARHAAGHGPFHTEEVTARLGLAPAAVEAALDELGGQGRVSTGEFRPGGSGEEWCDVTVLRRARQRSLEALRAQVKPVDHSVFVRFLADWNGIAPIETEPVQSGRKPRRPRSGSTSDAIAQLEGVALLASAVETSILAVRVDGYDPAELDHLCTTGEVVWIGAGAVGDHDGRVCFARRAHAAEVFASLRSNPSVPDDRDATTDLNTDESRSETAPVEHTLIDHLRANGASFWPELVAACSAAHPDADAARIESALWSLVWAGSVTNDSFAPVRSYRSRSAPTATTPRRDRRRRSLVRGPARTPSRGHGAVAGRWSLVENLLASTPNATTTSHALALRLLDRYGIVARESALGEGIAGGFAGVYPVFKALEEQGKVRRGYFIDGLGAAQFAHLGAVERLRRIRDRPRDAHPGAAINHRDARTGGAINHRDARTGGAINHRDARTGGAIDDRDEITVLAAADPAQPYGAALSWPDSDGRAARSAGSFVVFRNGEPIAYVARNGRSVVRFAPHTAHHDDWARVLAAASQSDAFAGLEIETLDGNPPRPDDIAALRDAGFERGFKGWRIAP